MADPAPSPGLSGRRGATLLTLALVGLLWWLSAGSGAPLAGTDRLAFVSDRDGNWEIYLMDVAAALQGGGGGAARLTDTPAEEWLPAWSPDGSRLAFVSDRDGRWELYLMDVGEAVQGAGDGAVRRLTNHPGRNWDPAWSPDGTRIAFSSFREGNWEIYLMDVAEALQGATGKGPVNLTAHPANDWLPTWSPDGSQIAFVSNRDGNWEIYAMGSDGSGQTNLTRHPADDWVPAWSPDGTRIAFQSDRDGNWEIYALEVADALQEGGGRQPANLTRHPAGDWDPAWSPDGRYLAFMSERAGNRELYVMDLLGGQVVRLTHHPAVDKNPVWQPGR